MEGQHSDKYTESGKLRKKYSRKPQQSKTNTTTSEAVMSSKSTVKGASKKINYDALKVRTFFQVICLNILAYLTIFFT